MHTVSLLRCIHGVGGHVNVQGNRLGGTQVLDRIWGSLKRALPRTLSTRQLSLDAMRLRLQRYVWMWYWRHRISSEGSDVLEGLGALMSKVNGALGYWITSRRQARSEKTELSKTRMGMRWSFRNTCLVRNDVFAKAKYKILKKWGAPTALLTLPHEAFEDGMYQNTVNNGMWIENGIKVTYK